MATSTNSDKLSCVWKISWSLFTNQTGKHTSFNIVKLLWNANSCFASVIILVIIEYFKWPTRRHVSHWTCIFFRVLTFEAMQGQRRQLLLASWMWLANLDHFLQQFETWSFNTLLCHSYTYFANKIASWYVIQGLQHVLIELCVLQVWE